MKADGRQLDPEIAGLLREIPRFQGLAILNRPLEDVPGYTRAYRRHAGLRPSIAERHLLEVYREEVAWLFRQAALGAMRLKPKSTLLDYVSTTERIDVPNAARLSEEARHYRGLVVAGKAPRETSALDELLDLLPVRSEHATRLAAASVNLVSRSDTKICLAMSMIQEDHVGPAKGILLDVVEQRPVDLDASIAWNNLGLVYSAQGRTETARNAFRSGALAASNPAPTMAWLFNSCQLGEEADAFRAAMHLDEFVRSDHPAVDEYLARRRLPAHLTKEFASTSMRLVERVGPTARRVMDV